MARKIDPEIQENVDRSAENDRSAVRNIENDKYNEDEVRNESETIKNANAAGLGAIGRNDQKQTGDDFNQSTNAGDE